MGLVHIEHGKAFVYEAVGPVKLTPADEWIARGEGKHYTLMRLKDADARLTPDALRKMGKGRPAVLVGDRTTSASDGPTERLYCSELVWKIYKEGIGVELGSLQRLGDFDLTNPLVQAKLRERYGARVPLEEPVISPGAIAASALLETVASTSESASLAGEEDARPATLTPTTSRAESRALRSSPVGRFSSDAWRPGDHVGAIPQDQSLYGLLFRRDDPVLGHPALRVPPELRHAIEAPAGR